MSVNRAGDYDLYQPDPQKSQDEILADLIKQGEALDREHEAIDRGHEMLVQEFIQTSRLLQALAEEEEQIAENIRAIRHNSESIREELTEIKFKADRAHSDQESCDKICRVIGGFIIVGLIATGIVICAIRYS